MWMLIPLTSVGSINARSSKVLHADELPTKSALKMRSEMVARTWMHQLKILTFGAGDAGTYFFFSFFSFIFIFLGLCERIQHSEAVTAMNAIHLGEYLRLLDFSFDIVQN
jgi:hypothetical protein